MGEAVAGDPGRIDPDEVWARYRAWSDGRVEDRGPAAPPARPAPRGWRRVARIALALAPAAVIVLIFVVFVVLLVKDDTSRQAARSAAAAPPRVTVTAPTTTTRSAARAQVGECFSMIGDSEVVSQIVPCDSFLADYMVTDRRNGLECRDPADESFMGTAGGFCARKLHGP